MENYGYSAKVSLLLGPITWIHIYVQFKDDWLYIRADINQTNVEQREKFPQDY